MAGMDEPDRIFEADETCFQTVAADWDAATLLAAGGLFFLKDIVGPLGLSGQLVIKRARQIDEHGQSARRIMGLFKVWNHWVVKMSRFAPYYRTYLAAGRGGPLPENELAPVVMPLTRVSELLGIRPHKIRYRVRSEPGGRLVHGVWKDPITGRLLVDLVVFRRWAVRFWPTRSHRLAEGPIAREVSETADG